MSNYSKKIVYLSQEQYEQLLINQTITVDNTTVNYNENDIYITPQATPLYPSDVAMFSDVIQIQDTEPISSYNQIWLTETLPNGIEVPTMDDFTSALNEKADKIDTVLDTTLSRGRAANTTIGTGSFAFGYNVEASGMYSFAIGGNTVASQTAAYAEGVGTTASGSQSHAEGSSSIASGYYAHAEGSGTTAGGNGSHAEGYHTVASGHYAHAEGTVTISNGQGSHAEGQATQSLGRASHSEGLATIANASYSHVEGRNNIEDSYTSWPEWVASTEYNVGDKVKVTTIENNETILTGYICKTANNDAEFTTGNWRQDFYMNYAHIVGNGSDINDRSNAYALTWEGDGKYAGDIYVNCSGDSTGGIKLAALSDIQIDGTSIISSGVANMPVANANDLGVVKVTSALGIEKNGSNQLAISYATSDAIKGGEQARKPITPIRQHEATFYGLAKAAGDTTQSQSDNAVGTYTAEAKAAIKSMIGVNVEDIQINGTSIVSSGIANIPVATNNGETGAVRVSPSAFGIGANDSGTLYISGASNSLIKAGTNGYKPITVDVQHYSTFYGLAKAAGDTTMSSSSNAVGTYTDNAKASIKSMLGIVDGSTGTVDVTGTTPTITAVENTRYVCGEVTSLDFTPPASGITIVRFTSGSSVTILTLPSTVKFPEWFDPTTLETNTIYEICITDGIYGAVMSWAL